MQFTMVVRVPASSGHLGAYFPKMDGVQRDLIHNAGHESLVTQSRAARWLAQAECCLNVTSGSEPLGQVLLPMAHAGHGLWVQMIQPMMGHSV